MEERNYKVYVHTNKFNNKKYVGITKRNPLDRWKNGNGYYSNEHFYNAIKKYGWDNFKHEILFDGLTQKEAEQKEIELIALFKSNVQSCGYNQTTGGLGYYGKVQTIKRKLPNYELVKDNVLFKNLIKRALGFYVYEKTEIELVANDKVIDRRIEIEKVVYPPNKEAIELLLYSYSDVKEIHSIIKHLKKIKRMGVRT